MSTKTLRGDGTWGWVAHVVDGDICVFDARITCFGGANDPQDSGETASGVSTKNPTVIGCALPMDGRMFNRLNHAEHAALDGSPIPRVPWKTLVRVTAHGKTFDIPVIDLGPAKKTKHELDLTVAAARLFVPSATATNFAIRGDFRILDAEQYASS